MENRIKIKMSDGRYLVAEANTHRENEIAVYIENSEDENALFSCQDICSISEGKNGTVDCYVWGDKDVDDYTDWFNIEKYSE